MWLLVTGCGSDAQLGEHSFRITQECFDSTCEPVCEDIDCDVCDHSNPPSEGGCWITGIGYVIDDGTHDNFGGNGMSMKDGSIRGEWEHVDHATGVKYHGRIDYLFCRHVDEPGPGQPSGPDHLFDLNQAYYGGIGRRYEPGVGWQEGFWFDVMAEDHGEPGNTDEYYFTVRRTTDTTNALYDTGDILGGGNFQIHPPNNGHPYTRGTVPTWVSLQP